MDLKDLNRRDMIKASLMGFVGLVSTVAIVACSKKEESPKKAEDADASDATTLKESQELSYVSETDNMATALGYKEDASKAPTSERIDKMGVKGVDQTCTNCQFFAAKDSTQGEGGTCTLFQGKLVKSKAWCKSWSKKS